MVSHLLSEVENLVHECFSAGLERTSVLIGLGGGVCTDLVTMAASLTRRGLSYMRIPTTLIGLIDAGIGIKGGVNLPARKNAIGYFHPPEHVFLDPGFLSTLPKQQLSEGLAEAIKVAITIDASLFDLIERHAKDFLDGGKARGDQLTDLVWRSALTLLDELESNIYEDKSYCRLLDFGHTFSPLIESESDFQISHGRAVSIDIATSTALAFELGMISEADRDRILRLLLCAGLPIFTPSLTVAAAIRALGLMEAHRAGYVNLVVPAGVGRALFIKQKDDVPVESLGRALGLLREVHTSNSNVDSPRVERQTPKGTHEDLGQAVPAWATGT